MSRQRSRSPRRSTRSSNSSARHHETTTVFGRDHDRYNDEWEIYDAIARAVKAYNHDVPDSNIRLGTLVEISKNNHYVVVPFTTTQVKSFTVLARDISAAVQAEVDISADIDIYNDAKIHFSFNVLRSSFDERKEEPGKLQKITTALSSSRKLQTLVVLLLLLYCVFYW